MYELSSQKDGVAIYLCCLSLSETRDIEDIFYGLSQIDNESPKKIISKSILTNI